MVLKAVKTKVKRLYIGKQLEKNQNLRIVGESKPVKVKVYLKQTNTNLRVVPKFLILNNKLET